MTKEQLVERIVELQNALEQSAAQHNALLGRLEEAKHMLKVLDLANEAGDAAVEVEMARENVEEVVAA